ncbi:MAG: nucleotide sugar dehydrogenase [Candidatus Hodarchaeales archaeon]|jgi:UDP-N-acetyl-D-mannosaminuronic acid dehydrogenase
MKMVTKVAVIGMGYVGIPIAALLADTGFFQVTGVQRRSKRSGWKIDYLNAGKCPIKNEPELPELIERVVLQKKTFSVTDDISVVKDMDYVLIDVQTPTDENNIPQYVSLREVSREVGTHLSKGSTVIIESTCAPGTTDYIVKPILEESSGMKCGKDFFLAFAYERVMVGRLIYNILNYARIVGGSGEKSAQIAAKLYEQVLKSEIIQTTAMTAEVAKVVENTYRDVNIAFANEVALVSESLGVDVYEVRKLVNNLPFLEGRGNPHRNMHIPGAGVGGHCLVKDPWLLKYGLTQYGKKPVDLNVIESSRFRNLDMPSHVVSLLQECITPITESSAQNYRIAVLGVAFIEDSDDPRNTPTRDLVNKLKAEGFQVVIHDHLVRQNNVDFPFSANLEEVIRDSNAVIIVTAHQIYKDLDLMYLKSLMAKNPILIDGRVTFNAQDVIHAGFKYRAIGRGQYRN